MNTTARIIIATLLMCLIGSISVNDAEARGGRGGHGPRVGIGLWLGPGWWGPYYSPYYYPYYQEPPIVIEQQPEVYVQPAPQEQQPIYWYFCRDPEGYYPYVKQCPGGWMKVVPTPPAPPSAEPE